MGECDGAVGDGVVLEVERLSLFCFFLCLFVSFFPRAFAASFLPYDLFFFGVCLRLRERGVRDIGLSMQSGTWGLYLSLWCSALNPMETKSIEGSYKL